MAASLPGNPHFPDPQPATAPLPHTAVQSTILSRFDLIFIVKDERTAERDMRIARHVLEVHRLAGAQTEADEEDKKVPRCAGAGAWGGGYFV